ncbi:MAG: tetratricopeptide repeat protein [Bacteroidota bacterium]
MSNLYLLTKFLVVILLISCWPANCATAQYPSDSLKVWVKNLSKKSSSGNSQFDLLFKRNDTSKVAERNSLLEAMKDQGDFSNPYFNARYYLYAATISYQNALPAESDTVKPLCLEALKTAYELGDEELIGFVSWYFGNLMHVHHHNELAVMYCLNAADIAEKTGIKLDFERYWVLGDVLYSVREYEKTIYYCKIAMQLMRQHYWLANCVNTIALSYQKLGKYDSAILYYDSAFLFIRNFGNDRKIAELWKGIISGNKGQVYFLQGKYSQAMPLFELDYQLSTKHQLTDNAANSLQWAAKTNLVLGNSAAALPQIREAFSLLAQAPVRSYYQNLYNTAADIYRAAGMPDSAFYFGSKYLSLHDSIEAEVASSRMEIARIRLENEKNYYSIRNFGQLRNEEIARRNLVITGILLMAIIGILYINSLRVKTIHREQIIVERNRHVEIEIAAAKKQLETFTQRLVEKSEIISQLQQQLTDTSLTTSQHDAITQLLQSTIITEDQWLTFKNLLEKIYPGFFLRLKESYPGITISEQRMAAFSKLRLSTKETATMLGISVESVHKTRQRLKQRLNLPGETKLEEYLAAF